ncbi:MAG TPA: hypothetical protein VHA09_01585 [Nitrososphaera sp.]|nr:hypothetical protein [Nitrososphaera sp.]
MIIAPIVGIGIAVVVITYLSIPVEPSKPADYDPAKITTIISNDENEKATTEAVDASHQRNAYERGAARSGAFGSTGFVYVSSDGVSFAVNV